MGSPRSQPPPSSPLRDSPPKSTGSPRVPLPQSRTRDNVDHAGLSPPLEPSRVLCKSHQELFSPSLSNNLLTAPSRTQDVTEDSWTSLSSTLRKHHSCSRPTTHTLVRMERHANMSHPRESVRLLPPRMSPKMSQASNLWPPSLRAQSPLPLKPINSPSRDIPVVSSPQDVARNSTTVFSLSVMVRDISSSRTHGVPHGVLTDTSRWPQASAVSPPPLPSHPSDSLDYPI